MNFNKTLYDGAPENSLSRIKKEQEVYKMLEAIGIEFKRLDHDAANTIEICEQIEKYLTAKICKNLFLCNRQQTNFYLLMMPGEKIFKTKFLSAELGCARLSFASPEKMEELINCTPGSASILGLMFDTDKKVQLLIDNELLNEEYIGCHPAINTSSLKIRTNDLFDVFLKSVNHTPVFVNLKTE